jgi:hypothetical protein
MPLVKNLINDEPKTGASDLVKKQDELVKPNGESQKTDTIDTRDLVLYQHETGLMIPDALADLPLAIPGDLPVAVAGQITGPYVARAHSMSPSWERQREVGCEEGDLYLAVDGDMYKVNPMGYFLIAASPLYYTRMKAKDGSVIQGTKDEITFNKYNDSKDERKDHLKPHYVTICFVQVRDILIPAKVDWFDTLVNGVSGAIRAAKASYDPTWGNLSEAHKVALGAPTPLARVFNIARTYKDVSKSSGHTMYPAVCVSKPATVDQINLFLTSFKDAQFNRRLEQVKQAFKERVIHIEEMCK